LKRGILTPLFVLVDTGERFMSEEIPVPQITATQLKARLDAGDDVYIVDVRNPDEWEIAMLPKVSAKIPTPQIQSAARTVYFGQQKYEDSVLAQIPKDREVIVQCHLGGRSTAVIMMLRELGYDPNNLVNLTGGITAWADEVDPKMQRY
jgi:sulfur-carrier protein adenylyltransferase/sulfurtransferase